MNDTLALRGPAPLAPDTRTIFRLLERLRGGRLEIRLPDGTRCVHGEDGPAHAMEVHRDALFGRVLARGDIGLAESYVEGEWDTPDLTALLSLFARNRATLRQAVYGDAMRLLLARLRHAFNRNSRNGSRRNIMAHYDLGNEFYALWLDESMSYSSALWAGDPGLDLRAAQHAKYDRILHRLQAACGQQVLEIGCGWGGFAERAVQAGLRVSGVTLSPAQLAWAQRRVPQADLRLMDYRDIDARFDHLVSIEMFEAVGERWWPAYFRTVRRALAAGGRGVVQSITIRDDLFARYRRGTDFIQQYIFPGGMLPSRQAFRAAAAREGLAVGAEFAFGADYARTLALWRTAFERHGSQLAALGFHERFHRLWRFYLAYCEAGFLAGDVDVVQFELAHA